MRTLSTSTWICVGIGGVAAVTVALLVSLIVRDTIEAVPDPSPPLQSASETPAERTVMLPEVTPAEVNAQEIDAVQLIGLFAAVPEGQRTEVGIDPADSTCAYIVVYSRQRAPLVIRVNNLTNTGIIQRPPPALAAR